MSPTSASDVRSPPDAVYSRGTANRRADQAQASQAALAELTKLAETDRHVRSHEQAHLAAAGQYARGGPSYQYQTGSDGRQYAIGGEVSIDTSPIPGDPGATAQKARIIQAAANAPADPSTQDRQVAAQAARMEQQALLDLANENRETGQIFSITA
jgi:hypothetical protein